MITQRVGSKRKKGGIAGASAPPRLNSQSQTHPRVQRIVSLFRYAQQMRNSATRNVLPMVTALAVGLALGALTKFGFQHDLSFANNPSPKVFATP
jgi:hypothetical protein